MSTTMPNTEKLALGPVARMTFGVIGRQPALFLLLPLLVVSLPTLGAQYLVTSALLLPDPMLDSATSMMAIGAAAGGGMGLLGILLHYVLQAMLTYGAVASFNGRRSSLGESLGQGLSALLPALGAAFLMLIGVLAGVVLLVVPGVILLCAWAVAVPAAVMERPGVLGALRRSRELTKGHRWRILGLFLFYIAISIGLSAIPVALAYVLITTGIYWLSGVVEAVTSAASATIAATGAAAIYAELRRLQEGAAPETLASVFD